MSEHFEPYAGFSIFLLEQSFGWESNKQEKLTLDEMNDAIIDELEKKHKIEYSRRLETDGFSGVVYSTSNPPDWDELINHIIVPEQNELEDFEIVNTRVSYILLHQVGNQVYAMTGGVGRAHIGSYIERRFGIEVLQRLSTVKEEIIRRLKSTNTGGLYYQETSTTRRDASVMTVRELNTIYNNLSARLKQSVLVELGFEFEADMPDKSYGLDFGNGIEAGFKQTLSCLKKVLYHISKILKRKPKYVMNFLHSVRDSEFKSSDLNEAFVKHVLKNPEDPTIEILGDMDEPEFMEATRYAIDYEGTYVFNALPTLYDVHMKVTKKKVTKLRNALKEAHIYGVDDKGSRITSSRVLREVLHGYMEYKGVTFYHAGGQWFFIDSQHASQLHGLYEEVVDDSEDMMKKVLNDKGLLFEADYESHGKNKNGIVYNEVLKTLKEVYHCDRKQQNRVELADAMFYDDNYLYIMHNKLEFSGSGARDLFGQVKTSASILADLRSTNKNTIKNYLRNNAKFASDTVETLFNAMFEKQRIVYVANFIKELQRTPKSHYVLHQVYQAREKLHSLGFKLCVVSTNDLTSKYVST